MELSAPQHSPPSDRRIPGPRRRQSPNRCRRRPPRVRRDLGRCRDALAAAHGAAARQGPAPARLGRASTRLYRMRTLSGSSRAVATRRRHSVRPLCAALRQLGTLRASAREGGCRARRARCRPVGPCAMATRRPWLRHMELLLGVAPCQRSCGDRLQSADGTCTVAAHAASTRCCPPGPRQHCWGGRLQSAPLSAEGTQRARPVRSRRTSYRRLCGIKALRQRSWGERLQSADGMRCARHARSRRVGGCTQCCSSARPSASAAAEEDCSMQRARRVATRANVMRRGRHAWRAPPPACLSAAGNGETRARTARAATRRARHAQSRLSGVITRATLCSRSARRRGPLPVLLGELLQNTYIMQRAAALLVELLQNTFSIRGMIWRASHARKRVV